MKLISSLFRVACFVAAATAALLTGPRVARADSVEVLQDVQRAVKAVYESPHGQVPGWIRRGGANLSSWRMYTREYPGATANILVFQGTKNPGDFWSQISGSFFPVDNSLVGSTWDGSVKVHPFYRDRLNGFWPSIKSALQNNCNDNVNRKNVVYVAGHSMGGALTHLLQVSGDYVAHACAGSYTIERTRLRFISWNSPRVGDSSFVQQHKEESIRRSPAIGIERPGDGIQSWSPFSFSGFRWANNARHQEGWYYRPHKMGAYNNSTINRMADHAAGSADLSIRAVGQWRSWPASTGGPPPR